MDYRYQAMTPQNARRIIDLLRSGEKPELNAYAEKRGSGTDYPEESVLALRHKLLELKKRFPDELKGKDKKGGEYEASACRIVHETLPHSLLAFSDADFWIWLAVARLPDIVEWRHGGADRYAEIANYGIGNRTENLIFRMWLRAEIVFDEEAEDPYHLSRVGDQDLWRSHIIRQGYANVRTVAKALIEFQFEGDTPRLSNNGIRELAKRLRRLRSNIMFEFMTPNQMTEIILKLADGLS